MSADESGNEPTPADFEDFVSDLLKIDPKGLSGKHHKKAPPPGEDDGD